MKILCDRYGPTGVTYDLRIPSDRRAFDVAIREKMKSAGVTYSKATEILASSATYADEAPTLNPHDPATREALHSEMMKRSAESKEIEFRSAGRMKAASLLEVMNGIFSDLAAGKRITGLS